MLVALRTTFLPLTLQVIPEKGRSRREDEIGGADFFLKYRPWDGCHGGLRAAPRSRRSRRTQRWGRTRDGSCFELYGGKIEVERPRVRGLDGREVTIPSWETAAEENWLGRWAMNLMLINVSTRRFGRPVTCRHRPDRGHCRRRYRRRGWPTSWLPTRPRSESALPGPWRNLPRLPKALPEAVVVQAVAAIFLYANSRSIFCFKDRRLAS